MDYYKMALDMCAEHVGKITTETKVDIKTTDDLSTAYTPGVAEPCRAIQADERAAYDLTLKANTVAVITDGTAVLGLGNIGPLAGLPVMEGKCVLFKTFGHVNAFPICLDCSSPEEIIAAVKAIAPVFGGINLEDIKAPQCFEIERTLERDLDIPVFHDDQHGTAVVVTSALINALKLTGKRMEDVRIALNGPGSAGTAIIHMLLAMGARHIVAVDRAGTIYKGRTENMNPYKEELANLTNEEGLVGGLADALVGADVFIGVSQAHCVTKEMVRSMAKDPIVFAMANPVSEIDYEDAIEAGAAVVGTGRSDKPNQINNVLCFPGMFRGALQVRARDINYDMKIAAAKAIAGLISEDELGPENIIASPLDDRVADAVAAAAAKAAVDSGVARAPENL